MHKKDIKKTRQKLLQNAVKFYYKTRQLFYYKTRQFYYKMLQVLQNASILLQNATDITKSVIYYKMGHNMYLFNSLTKSCTLF